MCSRLQLTCPLSDSAPIALAAEKHGTRPVDEHAPQIGVAAFADAAQYGLASGRVLSWNQPQPGGKLASPAERCSVADCGHHGGRNQRADAGDLAQPHAGFVAV